MLDTLTSWLSPDRRKALYALLLAVAGLASLLGNTELLTGVTGLVLAAFDLTALVLASIKARRPLFTGLYAIGAAVVGALKLLGIIVDGTESHILDVLAKSVAILPLLVALIRTDPSTPTGEPVGEYLDREHPPVPEGDMGGIGGDWR